MDSFLKAAAISHADKYTSSPSIKEKADYIWQMQMSGALQAFSCYFLGGNNKPM